MESLFWSSFSFCLHARNLPRAFDDLFGSEILHRIRFAAAAAATLIACGLFSCCPLLLKLIRSRFLRFRPTVFYSPGTVSVCVVATGLNRIKAQENHKFV